MKKLMILMLMGIILLIPFNTHAYDNGYQYGLPIYQLDQKISELNGHTLREVFEDGNLLVNGDFSDGINGWTSLNVSYFNVDNGIASFKASSTNGLIANYLTFGNDTYYIGANYKASNDNVRLTLSSVEVSKHTNPNQYELVSKIISWTYGTALWDLQIRDYNTSDFQEVNVKRVVMISTTSLGISTLTKQQLDHYYKYYQLALKYELDNKEAVKDSGQYKHIFMSIYEGMVKLMESMGSFWKFISTPILNSNIMEMGQLFDIDWSWNLFDIIRQLITDLALFVLQLNTYIISSLFFALGIPIKISILSLIFSDFVFIVLGWIMVKSFII